MLPEWKRPVHPETTCFIKPPPHTVITVSAAATDTQASTSPKTRPGPSIFSMMRARRIYRHTQRVQTSSSYAPLFSSDLDASISSEPMAASQETAAESTNKPTDKKIADMV